MKYYYGDIFIRKSILTYIQKIFDHERSIEEILSDYDITFENSQDIERIKKYIFKKPLDFYKFVWYNI